MTDAMNSGDLITSKLVNDVAVIRFQRGGIRDERDVLKALESLVRYVQSKSGLKILLDLENIEYISSAGLGRLVALLKRTRTTNGTLKLCRLQDSVRELFELMHLNEIFAMHPDVEEAIASFSSESYETENSV